MELRTATCAAARAKGGVNGGVFLRADQLARYWESEITAGPRYLVKARECGGTDKNVSDVGSSRAKNETRVPPPYRMVAACLSGCQRVDLQAEPFCVVGRVAVREENIQTESRCIMYAAGDGREPAEAASRVQPALPSALDRSQTRCTGDSTTDHAAMPTVMCKVGR